MHSKPAHGKKGWVGHHQSDRQDFQARAHPATKFTCTQQSDNLFRPINTDISLKASPGESQESPQLLKWLNACPLICRGPAGRRRPRGRQRPLPQRRRPHPQARAARGYALGPPLPSEAHHGCACFGATWGTAWQTAALDRGSRRRAVGASVLAHPCSCSTLCSCDATALGVAWC